MKSIQQITFGIYLSTVVILPIREVMSWNYEIKPVYNITSTEKFGIHKAEGIVMRAGSSVDTDTFVKEDRWRMCTDASKIDSLLNRKIKFFRNDDYEGKKSCYTLQVSKDNPDEHELAVAFECPTQPPMYLQLHYVNEKVWVIIKTSELPAICDVPDGDVAMKIVKNVTDVDHLQSSSFVYATVPTVDLNECADEVLLNMCKKASSAIFHHYNQFEMQKNNTIGPAVFYGLDLENQRELVFAFKCPIEPAVYLQVDENAISIIINETETMRKKDDM